MNFYDYNQVYCIIISFEIERLTSESFPIFTLFFFFINATLAEPSEYLSCIKIKTGILIN